MSVTSGWNLWLWCVLLHEGTYKFPHNIIYHYSLCISSIFEATSLLQTFPFIFKYEEIYIIESVDLISGDKRDSP